MMKIKAVNLFAPISIVAICSLLGCQLPVNANTIHAKGLTVSWAPPTASARTIMPSYFPIPSTYNISLQPTTGSPMTQTGITSTSWTFSNLTPSVYVVTVVGLDGSGNAIVQGTSSVDTTANASSSVAISLTYSMVGSGTGQINLTLDLSSASVGPSTATVRLTDPENNVTTPTLGISGSNYTLTNASAAVGSWQALFTIKSGGETAQKLETILVFQNVTTASTLNFTARDFSASWNDSVTWAMTTTGLGLGSFFGVTTDSLNNIFVAGGVEIGQMNFGNGVSATPTANKYNPVLVKYNSSGVAQWSWVGSIAGGSGISQLAGSLSVDSNSNLNVAMYCSGGAAVTLTLGNGITDYFPSNEVAISQFNSTGVPQWSQVISDITSPANGAGGGGGQSTTDNQDNVILIGSLNGTDTYSFGNGLIAAGTGAGASYGFVSKYSSSGVAQWVQTSSPQMDYQGGAVDSSRNIIAVGIGTGPNTYSFGNSVVVTTPSLNVIPMIVKYDGSGNAQWCSFGVGPGAAFFSSATADVSGNIFVVGYCGGGTSEGFGNGVVVSVPSNNVYTPLIVKYNASGGALWARTLSVNSTNGTSSETSWFTGVVADAIGNVYATGWLSGPGIANFGNGVTVNLLTNGASEVLVKYSPLGVPLWAQSTTTASSPNSLIEGIALDSNNSIILCGSGGSGTIDFGSGVTTTTQTNAPPLLIKYLAQ